MSLLEKRLAPSGAIPMTLRVIGTLGSSARAGAKTFVPLPRVGGGGVANAARQRIKSLFASFSSEKEDSSSWMRLLAIGRSAKDAPEMALFARYATRIRPSLDLVEFADGVGSAAEIKRREADALLAALKADEFVVALDLDGAAPDSAGFARLLEKWQERSRKISFVIGGAEGLEARVIARAEAKLSLGKMTWPHLLARALLAEQIYRAQAILAGHPYHRAGRP